ncbi:hypothetical protein HKD37_10G028667 [Glycine soja]
MYKDKWTQPWPMGPKIYPEVHENPRAFFNSSSPILLEPLAYGSGNWSIPREDCITQETCLLWWHDLPKTVHSCLPLHW